MKFHGKFVERNFIHQNFLEIIDRNFIHQNFLEIIDRNFLEINFIDGNFMKISYK